MKRRYYVETNLDGKQTLDLDGSETLCIACKGAGRWDSCFVCSNNGYFESVRAQRRRRAEPGVL